AVWFVNQHLVIPVVAHHEKAAILYLHHFMTVQDGVVPPLPRRHPVLDDFITVVAMTNDDILFGIRCRTQGLGKSGSGSSGEPGEKMAACFHVYRCFSGPGSTWKC